MHEVQQVRCEAQQPELLDRLVRVLDEQRGHTLAMEVEGAKIGLSDKPKSSIALDWIEPGLEAGVARKELVEPHPVARRSHRRRGSRSA